MSSSGLSREDIERIVHLEADLENVQRDVTDLKREVRESIKELKEAARELRAGLASTGRKVDAPLNTLSGIKMALVGLGGLIVGTVAVIGGLLRLFDFFRGVPPHP